MGFNVDRYTQNRYAGFCPNYLTFLPAVCFVLACMSVFFLYLLLLAGQKVDRPFLPLLYSFTLSGIFGNHFIHPGFQRASLSNRFSSGCQRWRRFTGFLHQCIEFFVLALLKLTFTLIHQLNQPCKWLQAGKVKSFKAVCVITCCTTGPSQLAAALKLLVCCVWLASK